MRADPRVNLVVYEQAMPLRGVEAWGRATLSQDGFHDVVRRTAARYVGPDQADEFAAGFKQANWVIRLVPEGVRAWDFADEA